MPIRVDPSLICGWVAPGFEQVRAAFLRNFAERGEVGAACAAYHCGQKVVDLWGGYRNARTRAPWEEETLVLVFSTTKGLAAMTLAVAHSRGWLDYNERVAAYWPEFGQQGKDRITVRQLLSHQAGLCAIDEPLDVDTLADLGALATILARQKPAWEPGVRHGYHALSMGWYEGALLQRVDPCRRSLGQFFQDEITRPPGIEFYIGLPLDIPDSRLAAIRSFSLSALLHTDKAFWSFFTAVCNPRSLTARAFNNPGSALKDLSAPEGRRFLAVENPAYTGVGQVRAVARAYSALATGGSELGLRTETLGILTAPPVLPSGGVRDLVLHVDTCYSLGFIRPFDGLRFGSSDRALGMAGAGGSFGFADPDAQVGLAYAPNRMGMTVLGDRRADALIDALYRCLGSS